jgi:hypothetical protein
VCRALAKLKTPQEGINASANGAQGECCAVELSTPTLLVKPTGNASGADKGLGFRI